MTTLRRACPAKLNLFLRVLGRRPDGYHDLHTVFHALALHDELFAERADGRGIALEVEARAPTGTAVPADARNLVWRAAERFFAAAGLRSGGVRFRLIKRVPAGAGLGGGSSNAAAALRLLDALYSEPLGDPALHRLAGGLGADVPFFLAGGTRIGTGIGDVLEPYPEPLHLHFLLILPPFGTATPVVYKNVGARLTGRRRAPSIHSVKILAHKELAVEGLENDLEVAAMDAYPQLARIRDRIARLGFPQARMSGSGSTFFLAFARAADADRAMRALDSLRDQGIVLLRTESDEARAAG